MFINLYLNSKPQLNLFIMAKKIFYLLLIVTSFSCKKNDLSQEEKLKKDITGRWLFGSMVQYKYDKDGQLLETTPINLYANDLFQFNDNNTYSTLLNNAATNGIYDVISDKDIKIYFGNDRTAPVRELSITNLNSKELNFIYREPIEPGKTRWEWHYSMRK